MRLTSVLDQIRDDLRHFGGPACHPLKALLASGPQALSVHRLGAWIAEARSEPGVERVLATTLMPMQRALGAAVRLAYDIDLDRSAQIGPGLKVFHFTGIRLRRCTLGEGCVIHQGVRLEPRDEGGPGPRVGARVWIGPHARVIGPCTVGDGATIAAGAVVTDEVPPRALVVGNPARVVRIDYDNGRLL